MHRRFLSIGICEWFGLSSYAVQPCSSHISGIVREIKQYIILGQLAWFLRCLIDSQKKYKSYVNRGFFFFFYTFTYFWRALEILLHYKCSFSVSAATCLRYAALWVIALWIVCVRACVCMHVRLCLFCSPREDPQCSGECPAADVPEVPAVPGAVWGESGMCHLILCMLPQPPPSRHWHHPAQIILTGQARAHLLCI